MPNNIYEVIEGRISKVEDRQFQIIQSEERKKKEQRKMKGTRHNGRTRRKKEREKNGKNYWKYNGQKFSKFDLKILMYIFQEI